MRGAAAERTGARVEDTLRAPFAVAPLPRVVAIVADKKIPAHSRVLGSQRVKRRHLVILGQPGRRLLQRIAARLEQHDPHARLGEPRGERAAAGPRADHDIIAIGIRTRRHPRADGSEVLRNSISARLSSSLSGGSWFCVAVPK